MQVLHEWAGFYTCRRTACHRYVRYRTYTTEAAGHHCLVPERYELFVYLSVEAFRNLTPQQKQEYVQDLKEYLDAVDIREGFADRSHSVEH